MYQKHPTYSLDKSFNKKLDRYIKKFLAEGFKYFSDEFDGIEKFIEAAVEDRSRKTNRDDHDLRCNEKEKYLLELISYKIYDELNREEFNKRKNCLIIMPDCLSIHDSQCEKVEKPYGFFCKRCLPSCQAFHIGELAKKYRVKIVFSKRKLSQQIEYFAGKMENLSVIGIACIMMLASGMRTAAEVGIPARGVLLNFTGCEHWNNEPFASEFYMDSLKTILEEKYGKRD